MASLDTTAGSLMDSWPVVQFSKLGSATRPALKQILGDLESKDGVACPDGESLTPFAFCVAKSKF